MDINASIKLKRLSDFLTSYTLQIFQCTIITRYSNGHRGCFNKTSQKEARKLKRKISTIILLGFIAMYVSCKGDKEEKSESEVVETKKEVIQAEQEKPKAPPPIGKGRLTGPDLAGVTERRKIDWIENQILHPEVMVEKDPIAKELLATYLVKMPNQNVTPEEAQAIIMYLREEDSEAKEESEHKK